MSEIDFQQIVKPSLLTPIKKKIKEVEGGKLSISTALYEIKEIVESIIDEINSLYPNF